jgi:hypothetical protein
VVLTKGQEIEVFDGTNPDLFSEEYRSYDRDGTLVNTGKPTTGRVLIKSKVLSLRDNFVHVVDDRDPDPSQHTYSTLYPSSDTFIPTPI